MNKFAQVLDILKKAIGGEGTRGGHIIGHTRSGKPVYQSSSHVSHSSFSSQDHMDAMNHHHEVWSKTQDRIQAIRKQNPNWNPPKQIHDFLAHHHTSMKMHQSRAGAKEPKPAQQRPDVSQFSKVKDKPIFTPRNIHKSHEITPFYSAVIVIDNEGKNFLLGKRKEDGLWTSPAGGAKIGEKPIQTAIRESFEEANLILDPRQFEELPMGYAHNFKPVHCYCVRLSPEQMSRISVVNDPDKEVKDWKWHPIEGKLPEPMDNNRFGTLLNAKMHLAGIIMKSYYNMDGLEGMTQVNPAEQAIHEQVPHPMQARIEELMEGYEPGDSPRLQLFDDCKLYLVRIDDGLYSGYVKRVDADGLEETTANIDKMTIPDMIQFLRAKQIIKEPTVVAPSPESNIEQQFRSLAQTLAGITVNGDLNITIQKAKALPIGTVRQWGVYKYVKHNDGWVVMGGEHHGKLMGGFKSEPKYSDFARHHESTSPAKEEPKKSEAGPTKAPESEPAKPEAPDTSRPSTEDVKKLTQQLDEKIKQRKAVNSKKVDEAAKEADADVERHKQQEEYRQKNERVVDAARASGAHTMSLKDYMKHAHDRKRKDLVEANSRPGPKGEPMEEHAKKEVEQRIDRHMESKKRSYNKDFKTEHRRFTDAAHRSGMEVHPDAMAEYPGMGGSSLPPEMDAELNKKTNMVQALDLGNTPKAVQKQFASHVNNCNKVVDAMGIKFKTPLTFKATGLTKLGKRTRGTFYDRTNTIELKDMSAAPKTLMHEIGHALDYSMNQKAGFMGRHSEMLTEKRAGERQGQEPTELHKMYGELHDLVTQSDYYKQSSGKHFTYLVKPTEVFARAFEVYALHKAEQMGMPPEFMDTFVPDVFKVKDQSVVDLRKEIDKLNSPSDYAKRQELAKQYNQKIEQTDGGWGVVPEEKQMEYKTKVAELMDKILAQDPIKKAMQEIDLLGALQDSEAFQKGQGLPVGSVRIWHGTKFIKQGDGHWVPLPSGQPGQGQAPAAQTAAPAQGQANLEAQKKPEQPGEGQREDLPHPTEHLKPKKGFGGHVEVHSKDLEHQLKNGPISIISAGRNPNNEEDRGMSDEHVNERYKRLEQDLKDHGYKYTKVKGKYGAEEDSYMVHHADENHMNDLGRKYNQDSVIHSKEGKNKLHFTTGEHAGKHHKGEGHEELPDAQDYYSEIKTADGQKKKFSLGLDFGKHHEADAETKEPA